MEQLKYNNRILISGTSRTGKSWFAHYLRYLYMKNNKRRYFVIIDDNLNNIKGFADRFNFKIQEIHSGNIRKNVNYRKFIQYYEKVIFIVTDALPEETREFINKISRVCWNLGDGLLSIDEAWQFLQRGANFPEEFKRVVRGGAKAGLDSLIVTHRIVDLDPDLINFFNIYVTFRNDEPNTIERASYFHDQFNDPDQDLIDTNLRSKYKKECKKLIKKYNNPEDLIRNLPTRYFLYADRAESVQEISRSPDFHL